MTRIVIEFKAEDEQGREILAALNQFPEYTLERAEMEGHLFMVLARCAWREADRHRQVGRRLANQRARKRPS